MFNALEKLQIKSSEYCFLLEDSDQYNKKFKVNIPKLMPGLSKDDNPKNINVTFDNNIFLNDIKCKPSTVNSINKQNYISLPRFRNTNFRFHPSIIHKKTRFICKIVNGDLRNMGITDDELNLDQIDENKSIFIRNPVHEILDRITSGDTIKFSYGSEIISTLTGTVSSINDWGVIAIKNSIKYYVAASNIIGVYTTTGTYKNNIRGDY